MVIPPSYSDLGKGARDLFGKGYNYGNVKLDCKTKTPSGIEFTTNGSSNSETGKICGSLESKYKWREYGLTLSEKWTTDNVLATELTIEDQIAKGLRLSFDTSFAPNSGKKSGKIKSSYKRDHINLNCDVDFDFAGPTVHGAAVVWYSGFLAGYQASFDTSKSKLTKNNFALGYLGDGFTIHSSVQDTSEFSGSIHQKTNPQLETGITFSWAGTTNITRFGIAAKYDLDRDTAFRVKVNNQAQVGLAFSHILREGIKVSMSTLIDGKNFNAGGHKFGIGLDLNQ